MKFLLDRYLLTDLLRIGLLTTGVLVTVIAFGAAVKPLADDDFLTASQTVKYILLAIVPMLQFALPFAFAFAATLVFQRLSSDHEIQAMSAAGISYRRILLPIAGLGVVLTALMLVLTMWLVPHFWSLMQRTIAADVTRLFEMSIKRGLPFQLNDMQIFADRLVVVPRPEDTGARTRFILFNVAAADLDDQGKIVTDVTARQAVVDVHRRDGRRYLKLVLEDAVYFNGVTGQMGGTAVFEPRRAIEIPDAFKDDPLFMSRGELLELRRNPDRYASVQGAKARLAEALRSRNAWQALSLKLQSDGRIEFAAGPERRFILLADRAADGRVIRDGGRPVRVEELEAGRLIRTFESSDVQIRLHEHEADLRVTFELLLAGVSVQDEITGRTNAKSDKSIPGLHLEDVVTTSFDQLSSGELIAQARQAGPSLEPQIKYLQGRLASLDREIVSRLQRRYALSFSALLLLLLGATMAMFRRQSVPLHIYLWVFLPAILSVILLSGGGQVVKDGHISVGIFVIWSGNVMLAAVLLHTYLKLSRN